jgi:uncharacterized protein (DUF697 family)
MKKKSLPKVMITSRESRTASDLIHDFAVDTDPSGSFLASAPALKSGINEGQASFNPTSDAPESAVSKDRPAHTEIANGTYPADSSAIRGVLPRARAERIVRHYAVMAGCGGIIPVPIVNISAITTIIVRMLQRLARVYDVTFERDRARALVISLLGGTLPTGFAVTTSSTLVYLIPGANFAAMAVSCVSAVACTRAIGHLFIDYFERDSIS